MSASGLYLTLNVSVTFSASFAGAKNIYLFAKEYAGGLTSGWQPMGTWTVPGGVNQPPTITSLAPTSGNVATQTFTVVYSDDDGYSHLDEVWFMAQTSVTFANACVFYYYRASNVLSLMNDAGTGWSPGLVPGSSSSVSNSQCTVNGTGSSANPSGLTITLNVSVTFSPSFAGTKNIYLFAKEYAGGLTSGWQQMGTWTVPGNPPPGGGADLNTYYTYDLLNHVTQVTMPRSTGTQTRTFNYINTANQVTAYLQSATNPENGTVSYTYTPAGNLATKIDAKGQKVVYTYDYYNRLSQVQRYPAPGTVEDVCQRVSYYYDTDPAQFPGAFSQYAWGRRTGVEYGNATCTSVSWSPFPGQFAERYSYTKGGLVTKKRLTVTANVDTEGGTNLKSKDMDTEQTYDNEGKVLTVKYPDFTGFSFDPTPVSILGPTYTYTYDGMGRPITLADNRPTPVNWVTNVQYGASNELKQIDYRIGSGLNSSGNLDYLSYQSETRAYNVRGQLTNIAGALNVEYRYSATQNNGQITQMKDWGSGEEVTYQYDSLQRLISAVTTGPEWGQSFTYDGFGNRTGATVTKGSAPSSSMVYDPATNRIVGTSYDLNGNMLNVQGSTLTYDVDNRVVSATTYAAGTEYYAYTPGNQRIWKLKANGTVEMYFYGISGQKLGTYNVSRTVYANTLSILAVDVNVYFGSRTIVSRSGTMARDRLGSSRVTGSKYYPYGEEQVVTAHDRDKYATYYRDGTTGLDYAQNRYYANTLGRFTSPDPYVASGGPSDPQSWNRYAYVQGDPINFNDQNGLQRSPIDWTGGEGPTIGPLFTDFGPRGDPPEFAQAGFDPRDFFAARARERQTATDAVKRALQEAVQALSNPECLKLFGTDQSRASGWDPVTALKTIYSDNGGFIGGTKTYVGYKVFNNLPIATIAWASPAVFFGGNTGGVAAGFRVDFNAGNFNEITAVSPEFQAGALLHEMGHIFAYLSGQGSGGSQIQYDGFFQHSKGDDNQRLILDKCFGLKLGRP